MWTALSILTSAALALIIARFQSDIQRLRERFSTKRVERRRAREAQEADQKERFLRDAAFRGIVMLQFVSDTSRGIFLAIIALACYAIAGFLGIVRTFEALEPLARAFGNDLTMIIYIAIFVILGGICLFSSSHLGGRTNERLLLFRAVLDERTGEQRSGQTGPE